MQSYEVVREVENQCANNQMRDIFFEEIETDDPVGWLREFVKGRDVEMSVDKKENGDVVIGPGEALFSTRVRVKNVNFIPFDRPDRPLQVEAKLRYTPKTAPCMLYPTNDGCELVFDEPQRAVTTGQSAVFYQGELLLGGGEIAGSSRELRAQGGHTG